MAKFVPFFWDCNRFFGLIDSADKWRELLSQYALKEGDDRKEYYQTVGEMFSLKEARNLILSAKDAPQSAIDELPTHYHFSASQVRDGKLRSFGFRREHREGTETLGEWAEQVGMDLRKL